MDGTTTNPVVILDAAVNQAGRVLDAVHSDRYGDPTPCREWDVRGLINHLVGGAHMFAAATAGQPADRTAEPPDFTAGDPAAAYRAATASLTTAWQAPGAMDRTVTLRIGDVPAQVALTIMVVEELTHGWDLAEAVGRIDLLDDSLAEAALPLARMIATEATRNAEGNPFGPEQPAPDGASAYGRLAAFMGRTPLSTGS